MQTEVLADAGVFETTPEQHCRTVDRASRDDHGLLGADDGELALLRLDQSSDADLLGRGGEVVLESVGGRRGRGGRFGEQETLDTRLDEELGTGVGGEPEPEDGSTLLLRVGAAESTVTTVVLVTASVLLFDEIGQQEDGCSAMARRTGMLATG